MNEQEETVKEESCSQHNGWVETIPVPAIVSDSNPKLSKYLCSKKPFCQFAASKKVDKWELFYFTPLHRIYAITYFESKLHNHSF